jgi:hypothetical protein
MLVGVPELAKIIGVAESRARFLVASGRIPGQLVGGRWVIDQADATNFRKAVAGRPLTERGAWQFIEAVSGIASQDLNAVERHRLSRRTARFHAADDPISMLISLLARRGDRVLLSAAPSDHSGLRQDPRLRLSGVSHPEAGLLAAEVEACIARRDLPGLVKGWFLVPAGPGARPNVLIHAVETVPDKVPSIVVAADLAEHRGIREQQAALEIITRIRGH